MADDDMSQRMNEFCDSRSGRNCKDVEGTFFDPDMVYKQGPSACLRGAMARGTGQLSGRFWDTFQPGFEISLYDILFIY